jgi:hypothetical protein
MTPRNAVGPATVPTVTGARIERFGGQLDQANSKRTPRRQRLARHLHQCGPRPVLEALIAVEGGAPLDEVLEDFCRLVPEVYQAMGADVMSVDRMTLIDGGRR